METATIFVCPQCEVKGRIKGDTAGRTLTCPGCGNKTTFPPAIPPEAVSDPEPGQVKVRPWYRSPVVLASVVVLSGSGIAALLVFQGASLGRPMKQSAPVEVVAKQPPGLPKPATIEASNLAPQPDSSKASDLDEAAKEKKLVDSARLAYQSLIIALDKNTSQKLRVPIGSITARQVQDARRIDSLWEVSAVSVAIPIEASTGKEFPPQTFRWSGLIRCTPEGESEEIWREITYETGRMIRTHLDTIEWKPEFCRKVRRAWLKHVKHVASLSDSDDERRANELNEGAKNVAYDHKISVAELSEIIDATD